MAYEIRPVGAGALLVELSGADDERRLDEVHGLARWLRRQRFGEQIDDLVPATSTLLVRGEPAVLIAVNDALGDLLDGARGEPDSPTSGRGTGRTVEIAVRYDGTDLDAIAAETGMTREEVMTTHRDATYDVAYFGFAPGVAFLRGVPDALRVRRRESPRTKVSAGSVAIANEFSIVYPGGTPGGWQVVATAIGDPLWDVTRDPPNAVDLGDRVRFVETDL